MASEMIDLIDWSHPPPSQPVPPERLVYGIIGIAQPQPGFDLGTLQPSACEATTLPMRPLRVYSDIQIYEFIYMIYMMVIFSCLMVLLMVIFSSLMVLLMVIFSCLMVLLMVIFSCLIVLLMVIFSCLMVLLMVIFSSLMVLLMVIFSCLMVLLTPSSCTVVQGCNGVTWTKMCCKKQYFKLYKTTIMNCIVTIAYCIYIFLTIIIIIIIIKKIRSLSYQR